MGKRLDESKIKEIINLHKQGFDARAIARMTGVDQTRTRLIGICKLYPEFLRDHNLPEPTEFERWRSKNLWFTDLHGLLSDFLANKDFSQGCIEWPVKMANGYGVVTKRPNKNLAHRLSLEIKLGRSLDNNFACHSCDNPGCCNPAHLFEGDHRINSKDMVSKRRAAHSEKHSQVKYTEEQVKSCISMRKNGHSFKEISNTHGISESYVRRLCNGNRWIYIER